MADQKVVEKLSAQLGVEHEAFIMKALDWKTDIKVKELWEKHRLAKVQIFWQQVFRESKPNTLGRMLAVKFLECELTS